MMIAAAIYARKSTEQSVSDDAKSVTRQVELARAFALAQGWTVDAAHVYVDDAASGGAFNDKDRPAFYRLLAAAPHHPFAAVVMMDESRLGRDQYRTAYALQLLTDADVAVWYYQDRRRAELTTATGKFMESVKGYAAEMEREKARARSREVGSAKAAKGHVTGGRVFGYRNVRADGHVRRVIDPAEAAIVRRLFEAIAAGPGFTRVAKQLTAEGVPSPHPGRGWAATAVREMLFRPLYRGHVIYGRTRWVDREGKRIKVKVPPADWITREAPELRIVDEGLWQAAHARLDRTRAVYLRHTQGRLWGRPDSGIEAKYLLTGFLECAVCHGGMHATKRTSQRGAPAFYYVCREHRVRGDLLCTNSLSAPMADLHGDLVEQLRRDVLSPTVFEAVLSRALELERSPEAPDHCAALADELARLEREIARFTEAVAQGGSLPSILTALQARERRRQELLAQLEHQDGLGRAVRAFDSTAVRGSSMRCSRTGRGSSMGSPRRRGRSCARSSRGGS